MPWLRNIRRPMMRPLGRRKGWVTVRSSMHIRWSRRIFYKQVKKCLDDIEVQWIHSIGEADHQLVRLFRDGEIVGILANDGDFILHGCVVIDSRFGRYYDPLILGLGTSHRSEDHSINCRRRCLSFFSRGAYALADNDEKRK